MRLHSKHTRNKCRSYHVSVPLVYVTAFSLLFLLTCPFGNSTARADSTSVMADGVAVLRDGAVPEARHAAVTDALSEAVRQVTGQMVESTVLVENSQLVTDRIQTKTIGYVANYRVLRERQDPGLYRVTVEAVVDRAQLGQDLDAMGLLYRKAGNPRFLVIVNDSFAGAVVPEAITETEIGRLLIARGFEVVDQAVVSVVRQGEQVRQLVKGSFKAAQVLGQQLGADVLIVGDAGGGIAMRGGPLGGMVSVRSNLQAKAIRADTGAVLCAETVSAAGIDISDAVALRKSLGGVAGRWVDAGLSTLMARWGREGRGENMVLLSLNGLTFDQLDQFIHTLKTRIAGITSVRSRGFSEKVATVEVSSHATGEALGRDLRRPVLQPFRVDISSISDHRIEAHVHAR